METMCKTCGVLGREYCSVHGPAQPTESGLESGPTPHVANRLAHALRIVRQKTANSSLKEYITGILRVNGMPDTSDAEPSPSQAPAGE